MHNLFLHSSNNESNSKVSVDFQLTEKYLLVNFTVNSPKIVASKQFCKESFENWGLWEKDVVEVFVTKSTQRLPYLELQLSPLNQKFALLVKSPRKSYSYPESLNTALNATVEDGLWRGSFKIPYTDIPGDEKTLFGNFYACIGEKESRSFFGLVLDDEEKVDFHRPEIFKKLGELPC